MLELPRFEILEDGYLVELNLRLVVLLLLEIFELPVQQLSTQGYLMLGWPIAPNQDIQVARLCGTPWGSLSRFPLLVPFQVSVSVFEWYLSALAVAELERPTPELPVLSNWR